MTKKLLSNLPLLELNEETDYLEILSKGKLIKTFLQGSKENINDFRMFALYGDWGSGKSTLMKYLHSNLSQEFNTFFFEAWEFEKDENLAMSLLEFLKYESTDVEEELFTDLLKYGGRLLRGLAKSVKLNIPLYPNGPAIELEPNSFLEEFSKNEELTFYKALKEFKTEFKRMEDFITKGDKPKFNIIFIDDLDRCEPQQVLNLISAIKLFFTYGEKTIFFCGVDKKAVEAAVTTKYGNLIKANQYLEKIFDISFSMPEHFNSLKLISFYFNTQIYTLAGESMEINKRIDDFFKKIEFTNPRRIKKVLNKFQILRDFIQMDINEGKFFPKIDLKTNIEYNFFETILTLYLIILSEFYPSDFEGFLNFEIKKNIYSKANVDNTNMITKINGILEDNLSEKSLNSILLEYQNNKMNAYSIETGFFICLAPLNVEKIKMTAFQHQQINEITVKEKFIDYLFYKYISSYKIEVLLKDSNESMNLFSIKRLIKDFL